ncbi:MAG: YdiU family protein [Candidatus Thiodiazotropha weberae]|nr:YdiU family protein [Candidatus Thiodiazotropha lotti]MCG7928461.1 YdiU family protein [Candidatus Thiodiazotropha lotti]MCG7985901.1 YdiU family protein [Candidatus Thiodiazotropha lotti]MCG8019800.1 YdiU family protein [Candidatus Thiodiazotropha lotti]MCW4206962.1 YdiU family protein [Candidatus Thiodiazotropha lotti]
MVLSNSYTELGGAFYQSIPPEPVREPKLFLWNSPLAETLQLERILESDGSSLAQVFSGNRLLPGANPIALAYAGHQFGHFVAQLGDGRAHLLGELTDCCGELKEIQLKGSGPTPYSRSGDGRYALGPAIREFIMGEALHAMGIPTTRSLAVITTGETVYRETPNQGAVLTRIAASHLRVGSFEYFAAKKNHQALKQLSDFAIGRHYPELQSEGEARFALLLEQVIRRQVDLVVEWLRVGFIHGVMNTDNTTISGETIDYGPCAMMGVYSPDTVFSSIDRAGRYAFGNQAAITQWNMARFAETLLPLIHPEEKRAVEIASHKLEEFGDLFNHRYLRMMARKIGITQAAPSDAKLISELLQRLQQKRLDYTESFDRLTRSLTSPALAQQLSRDLGDWYQQWQARLSADGELEQAQPIMRQMNPLVIPRNQQMEQVIQISTQQGDASAAEQFLEVLRSPYSLTDNTALYQQTTPDADLGYRTFCGT